MFVSEKKGVLLICLVLAAFFITLSFITEGLYEAGDNIVHYRIARYSFKYPYLLLDHWGKPLFTALSAPFAQFGFQGVKIFNIIGGIISAYFSFLLSRSLGFKNSWLAIPITLFAPTYFILLGTALTEILFSLVLITGSYLFFKNKFTASAIVISFLPFARTEGIIILPLFFLAFAYNRQYKGILCLATGTVFYSFIGFFYYNDFLWLINKNPYGDASGIYGSGELLHFVKHTRTIIGWPAAVLFIFGAISLAIEVFFRRKYTEKPLVNELLIVFFPIIIYLVFHSILWWKGMGGSLGLTRVMAGVIPLIAVVSIRGCNLFSDLINFNILKNAFVLLILCFHFIMPFTVFSIPLQLSEPDSLIKQTAVWLKDSEYYNNKIYYYNPLIPHFLDIDPFDKNRVQERIPNLEKPEEGIPKGSIIIWDAHFGPNEGRLPLHQLLENKNFKVIKVVKPMENFQVLGGHDYEIYVFEKMA